MFEWRNGELYCENVKVSDIAKHFGTPLYVYSKAEILKRIGQIKSVFGDTPHIIAYSLKANNNPHILRIIRESGLGADTVSGGEVKLALETGFLPSKVVFAGVGKREDEIELAIERGIKLLNIESEEELNVVEKIAGRVRKKIHVALRINPDVSPKTIDKIATAKKTSKFGIDLEKAEKILKTLTSRWVTITGLHVHIGSQIFEWEPYMEAVKKVEHLFSLREFSTFDVGGGFGVDYEGIGREFDFLGFKINVLKYLKNYVEEVITEPGRFIIAKAGILVTKVLYRKRDFIIVDAGMNDFSRPAYYGARHRIVNVVKRSGDIGMFSVGGPVCESTDVFGRNFELELPERGDFLAIMDTGAYGMTMASNYNARPRPAEVLCDGNRYTLIRKREDLNEILWRGIPD